MWGSHCPVHPVQMSLRDRHRRHRRAHWPWGVERILPNRRFSDLLRLRIPTSPPRPFTTERRALLAVVARTLEEHKAIDLLMLDLRTLSNATDVFVIASGTSDTHVRALAQHVLEALMLAGDRPHHVEGIESGRWVLIDMVDYVVHIFHPDHRRYYQLERLWADAPPVSVDSLR